MIVGAILAGATDLSYSLAGYVYVGICAVSTAVYLILIRLIQDRTGAACSLKPPSPAGFLPTLDSELTARAFCTLSFRHRPQHHWLGVLVLLLWLQQHRG